MEMTPELEPRIGRKLRMLTESYGYSFPKTQRITNILEDYYIIFNDGSYMTAPDWEDLVEFNNFIEIYD